MVIKKIFCVSASCSIVYYLATKHDKEMEEIHRQRKAKEEVSVKRIGFVEKSG